MFATPNRTRLAAVALAAVVVAVFWPALRGELVYDDLQVVARNPCLRSFDRLPEALTGAYWDFLDEESAARIGYWRPLTTLALFAAQQLGGGAPWVFHAVALGLHAAAAAVAFLLLRRLGGGDPAAFAGALLFAVHPLQVEAVSWISAVSEPLQGLLVLLGLWAHLRWRDRGSVGVPVATACCLAAGLAAKESAAALVPMALALDFARSRRDSAAQPGGPGNHMTSGTGTPLLRAYGPLAVVGVLYALARMGVFHDWRAGFDRMPLHLGVPFARLASLRAEFFGGALELLAWPARLVLFREVRPVLPPSDPALQRALWWSGLWVVGLGLAAWRRRRDLAGALLLIPAGVLPVLLRLEGVGRFPLSDRFLYLSVLGAAMFVARLLFGSLPRTVAAAVVLALALPLGLRARARIGVWENESTLFRHAVAETPRSVYTNWGLGRVLLGEYRRTGDPVTLTEALDRFKDAQDLASPPDGSPPDPAVLVTAHDLLQANLGVGWYYLLCAGSTPDRCGFAEAELVFRAALERFPESDLARVGLGVSLMHMGRLDQAANYLFEAVDINPLQPETWFHLGRLECMRGNWESAVSYFESSLELQPDDVAALTGLGEARLNCDLNAGAERALRAALARAPEDPRVMTQLGALAGRRGNMQQALGWLDRALAIDHRLGDAHLLRAKALLSLGEIPAAVEALQQACTWSPNNFEANYNLGVLLMEHDLVEQGADYLRHALELEPDNELAPRIRRVLEDGAAR